MKKPNRSQEIEEKEEEPSLNSFMKGEESLSQGSSSSYDEQRLVSKLVSKLVDMKEYK